MIKPVLKWAGGKTRIMHLINDRIESIYKSNSNNYSPTFYDVFSGGGSVTLNALSRFSKIVMNDRNNEVINVYKQIKENPQKLIKILEHHESNHSKDYYNKIRKYDRFDDYKYLNKVDKAGRTIYLNKTCFNGLYRVNSNGQFNVPIGKPIEGRKIYDLENIIKLSEKLKNVDFQNKDFKEVIKTAKKGDIVYFDPPYDPFTEQSFVSYTKYGFNREDQKELRLIVDELTKKGVFIILSNSATDFIKELYDDYIQDNSLIMVRRNISANKEGRVLANEILIDNLKVINDENKNNSKQK